MIMILIIILLVVLLYLLSLYILYLLQLSSFNTAKTLAYDALTINFQEYLTSSPESVNIKIYEHGKTLISMFTVFSVPVINKKHVNFFLFFPCGLKYTLSDKYSDATLYYYSYILDFIKERKGLYEVDYQSNT